MIKKTNALLTNRIELLLQTLQEKDYEISELLVAKIYALKNIDDDLDTALEDVMYGDYEKALMRLLDYLAVQKLYSWADTNNIPNAKFSRDKNSILKTKTLNFTSLKLDELPNEIASLTDLEELVLWYCDLKSLPKDIVKLRNLKKLNLRANPNLTLTEEQKIWLIDLETKAIVYRDKIKNIASDFEDNDVAEKEVKTKNKIRFHEIAKKLNLSSKEVISQAQQLGFQVKTAMSTLNKEDADKLVEAINKIDKSKNIQNDVTLYDDKELSKLKKELKNLESKLQTLIEQKTEYLNNIEEFNREYNLHLGDTIRDILNLKREILYKKTIKQQKQKEKYEKDILTFEETKETIDELKNTVEELEEALESIDESHESYDEIKSAHEELQEELRKLEEELELQEEELIKAKEFIEDDAIKEEYEEAKSHYDEYENGYEQIQQNQKDRVELRDDEKAELKKLYKKAARLCHPDIVANELKEKAHEMMQKLNEAYSRQDLVQLKKILYSLESGTIFNLTSDSINDKESLKEKIEEYKDTLKHIEDEIATIQEDDTYKTISNIEDWDEYFEELKGELEKEKERLEEEAKEVLAKNEEPTQEISINEDKVSDWMQKLWDWADENKISKSSIPRNKEQLLKLNSLEIINKPLDYVPIELSNLTSLSVLKLWDCVLEYLPLEIVNLTNLKTLNLRGNKLSLTENQKKWLSDLQQKGCFVYHDNFISFISEDVIRNKYSAIYKNTGEHVKQDEIVSEELQKVSKDRKTEKSIIQKEYKTPYAEHILSIENPNFEKIRRYCNNLVNENQAGKMQEFLAQNGKMYKALIYDALEQFLAQLNEETITLIDWGCDQGIASMLVRDYIREKQLDIKVSQVILIDSNKAKLSRAMTQIEAVAQDEIKIIALKSDDNRLFDTIKTNKNNITLNLFANDKMPVDRLDIDYHIFEKDYFMCVSNESKEFVDQLYEDFTFFKSCHDVSIRDGKIGRFQRYERVFFTEEKNQDPWDLPF